MKKLTLAIAVLIIGSLVFISFSGFKSTTASSTKETSFMTTDPNQACPVSCSCVLNDGTCLSNCSYDVTAPTPTWKVPNLTWGKTGSVVTFSSLDVCYTPGPTPPWTSSNRIGTVTNWMGNILVPTTTKVFTATSLSGATFQCTLYNTGAFYIQHIGGTVPGKGVSLSGSYTL